ncbi:MAG: NFACT family protein, partial [Bacteroidales bacterium]|nr:NFACT family protein [Bacteroidales bacterium]
MPIDGTVVANLAQELNTVLTGARLSRIAQPEADELLLTCKTNAGQTRLLLSANASLPLAYLTEQNKQAPMTAPNFCMLLRKHLANGRILSVTQPDYERVLIFTIEHLDELGDPCRRRLILELMGKHSNLILVDEDDRILDSIKHISAQVSSVREVLPGRSYFIPLQEGKTDPRADTAAQFLDRVKTRPTSVAKALYGSYTGVSPLFANELCYRAGIDGDASCASVTEEEWDRLADAFQEAMEQIRAGAFAPHLYRENGVPVEFFSLPLFSFADCEDEQMASISAVLESFYAEKNIYTRIRQKSTDLRHIVNTHLDRARKKLDLQRKQYADTEKRDRYKRYGELIHTYGYNIPAGAKNFEAVDYETNEPVTVPLDPTLSPMDNAAKYFNRYGKLKRTAEALTVQLEETQSEISYLESVATALDLARTESDLAQIREELTSNRYIRARGEGKKKQPAKSTPCHYRSSDGYDLYVGKNNLQNDELTFHFAEGGDWWFHAKQIPGSHV